MAVDSQYGPLLGACENAESWAPLLPLTAVFAFSQDHSVTCAH